MHEHINKEGKDEEFREEFEMLESGFRLRRELISARKSVGLTQQNLAKKAGVNLGTIGKIEKGIGNPSLSTLNCIARSMGKKLIILFE